MANGNLAACLKVTLSYEGGWADHPKDPGGATMKGVTLAVYRKYKPGASKADLRAISDAEVKHVYDFGYWRPVSGENLPAGVDLAVFDFGVNSGVSRASKYLQAAVGVAQDGKIGAKTLIAVAASGSADLVQKICAKRLGFVRGLSTFSTFGKGWARRIADVEARGVKMAGSSHDVGDALMDAKEKASNQNTAAAGAGTAGAGAGLGLDLADMNIWVIVGAMVVVGVIVALVKSRANVNKIRAEAYQKVIDAG